MLGPGHWYPAVYDDFRIVLAGVGLKADDRRGCVKLVNRGAGGVFLTKAGSH